MAGRREEGSGEPGAQPKQGGSLSAEGKSPDSRQSESVSDSAAAAAAASRGTNTTG